MNSHIVNCLEPRPEPRPHSPPARRHQPARACLVGLGRSPDMYAVTQRRRGRDRPCGRPPAQIPACGITALGSYLGCVAAKRACGNGCTVRVWGIHRVAMRFILSQLIRVRWLAAPQRRAPVSDHLGAEGVYRIAVAGHGVVGLVPAYHGGQPSSLVGDGQAPAPPDLGFHLGQLGPCPFGVGFPPDPEPSAPGGRADVREQVQFAAVVKLVRTMLWTWGRGRPWGLVWCSKEAMTQCWGLTGANRVRPVPCMNSSTA